MVNPTYLISRQLRFKNQMKTNNNLKEDFKKVCEDCVYRECYGSKNWRTKKREGSLNDTSK